VQSEENPVGGHHNRRGGGGGGSGRRDATQDGWGRHRDTNHRRYPFAMNELTVFFGGARGRRGARHGLGGVERAELPFLALGAVVAAGHESLVFGTLMRTTVRRMGVISGSDSCR